MRKCIKTKIRCSKTRFLTPSLNMTTYERNYILCNLLNVLFNQVKLQQEVRDRWFGHYLTIIGALVALATLCLKLFENAVNNEILYMFLGLVLVFSSLLGVFFFILYLCQRKNYKQIYGSLRLVQNEIFKSIFGISNAANKKNTFVTHKHGADFYTLLIQKLINSTMFAVGCFFINISLSVQICVIITSAIIEFILMFILLQLIYRFFEQKGHSKK